MCVQQQILTDDVQECAVLIEWHLTQDATCHHFIHELPACDLDIYHACTCQEPCAMYLTTCTS